MYSYSPIPAGLHSMSEKPALPSPGDSQSPEDYLPLFLGCPLSILNTFHFIYLFASLFLSL